MKRRAKSKSSGKTVRLSNDSTSTLAVLREAEGRATLVSSRDGSVVFGPDDVVRDSAVIARALRMALLMMTPRVALVDRDEAHDDYLKRIIVDAVSYVSKSTGAEGDDLLPLRAAAVSVTREIYDGVRQIKPTAAHNTWMNVYRSYKKAE